MSLQFTLHTALRHHQEGRLAEAEALYRQVLAREPDNPDAMHLLGVLLYHQGNHPAAAELIRRAIQIKPGIAEFHNNLGAVLTAMGCGSEAAAAIRKAVELKPDYPDALNNLGNVLKDMGLLDDAVASYRRALTLNPGLADALNNLGNVAKLMGRLDEAIECHRRSLALRPNPVVASNLLYLLHFHPDFTPRQIHEEHVGWEQLYARPLAASIAPHPNDRSPDRRLKIGYVSPDLRAHPVGRFLTPLLAHHDHQNHKIVCYSDAWQPDDVTRQLEAHADVWRQTAGMSHEKLTELVRQDGIDVLVDLTMHMQGNRMLVFARKPAPVQVTYLAYCGTTGLRTMDYRLSDPYLDPHSTGSTDSIGSPQAGSGQAPSTSSGQAIGGDESVYSEKTVRLAKSYWCYQAPPEAPPVRKPPAVQAGHVTFGCLNNYAKVTPRTLEVWCELLTHVPGSQLILYAHEGSHRQEARDTLGRHAVDARRLRFVPMLPLAQYLAQYQQLDIALDPFPYPGGTTTCDALWMGVPVVTLIGQSAVSRAGLSILSNVGLGELVARTPGQYIQIAAGLASDIARLGQLRRASLRDRMLASPIMDAPRFARDIEDAYREMWRSWFTHPSY